MISAECKGLFRLKSHDQLEARKVEFFNGFMRRKLFRVVSNESAFIKYLQKRNILGVYTIVQINLCIIY